MSKDGIFPPPDKMNGKHNNRFIPTDKAKCRQLLYSPVIFSKTNAQLTLRFMTKKSIIKA
ncbi:hypothetical protein CBW52_06095 [Yersinia kristensenii]|uniref:Uncharacterized protein n=1 Tax=Yersinia kristensenii TaxID=28152 RepID=A0AB73NZ67_YERKR|nr:hypothetical protein CBW52_06095 [Yersinia kristensenii]